MCDPLNLWGGSCWPVGMDCLAAAIMMPNKNCLPEALTGSLPVRALNLLAACAVFFSLGDGAKKPHALVQVGPARNHQGTVIGVGLVQESC